MPPTNEQIIAEATRRRTARGQDGNILDRYVIEVMRENWKPHEPVDPDVLAFREWLATSPYDPGIDGDEADLPPAYRPGGMLCQTFLAGASMAREQERERAGPLVRYIEDLGYSEYREAILAKYRGEA